MGLLNVFPRNSMILRVLLNLEPECDPLLILTVPICSAKHGILLFQASVKESMLLSQGKKI